MKKEVIILSNKFDRSISTRAAVKNLFKDIKPDELVIDFSSICFISSSAAHQMVIEIKRFEERNISVTCENVNVDVSRMMELAKTDRKNLFTMAPVINHYVIQSEKDLSKLLLGSV
jgi:anti-anti-sigma regulatory factor